MVTAWEKRGWRGLGAGPLRMSPEWEGIWSPRRGRCPMLRVSLSPFPKAPHNVCLVGSWTQRHGGRDGAHSGGPEACSPIPGAAEASAEPPPGAHTLGEPGSSQPRRAYHWPRRNRHPSGMQTCPPCPPRGVADCLPCTSRPLLLAKEPEPAPQTKKGGNGVTLEFAGLARIHHPAAGGIPEEQSVLERP